MSTHCLTRDYPLARMMAVFTTGFATFDNKISMIAGPLPIVLLFITVIFVVVTFFSGQASASRYWPEWFLLLVPDHADEEAIVEELHSQGIENALSASTAVVHYMAIPELAAITVDQIDERLVIRDPRRDPFLQNVDELFQSGSNTLIYLPAEISLMAYRKILKSSPIFDNLKLLDDTWNDRLMACLLFCLIVGGMIPLLPGQPLSLFLAALPWMPLVLASGMASIYLILAGFVLTVCRGGHGRPTFMPALGGSLIVLFFVWRQWSPQNFALFLVTALSSEAVCFIVRYTVWKPLRVFRKKHRDHKIFKPLSLIGNKPVAGFPLSRAWCVKSCVVLVLMLPFAVARTGEHAPVPAAGHPIGRYDSLSAIHGLMRLDSRTTLPDISDILSSAAYQEGFLRGAQFELPLPGRKLTLNRYFQDGVGISMEEITEVTYSREWYKQTMRNIFSDGVGRLFAAHKGPSPVINTQKPIHAVISGKLSPLQLIVSNLVVFLTLVMGHYSMARYGNDARRSPLLSTKMQAA